ncbi:type 4b pilus protein PilO2 [Cupriavidus sp. TMH.W2]|uniref:type 4b pilus protein PilO2 n=1 Tax=Cupriavidus sp. TMH.W2 TaxID=3434465 RepID=UPI003D77E285
MIGGTAYAVGLLWQSASKPKGFMREVKAFTRQYGLRQFVIREGAMTQIGYVVTAPGARPIRKAQALVPTLADQLGASWLGVFKVTERTFVMGGVHNGAIRPDAEMIGSEEDVRARFSEVIALPWARVIAPKTFLAGAESLSLDTVLSPEALKASRSGRGKSYPIRSSGPDFGRRELFMYGGTAGIALIGSLIQHQVTVARQEEENRRAAAVVAREAANLENERKAAMEQIKGMAPVPPWPNEPAAKTVLARCMTSILAEGRIPVVIEGWRFMSVTCNGNRLSVTYGRTPGASEDAFLAVARSSFPSVSVAPEVGTASGPVTMQEPMLPRGEVALASTEQTELDWNSHFQRLNAMKVPELTKKSDPPKKPPPPTLVKLIGEAQAQVPDPWWAEYTFSVSSPFPIDQVMGPTLGPGLVISEVKLSAGLSNTPVAGQQSGLQWTINGVVYAKK